MHIIQLFIYSSFIIYIMSFNTKRGQILNNIYLQQLFLIIFILISLTITIYSGIDYLDKARYTSHFFDAKFYNLKQFLEIYNDNFLFYLLTYAIAQIFSNPNLYYTLFHLLFIYFLLRGIYLIFHKNLYLTVLCLFLYLNFVFYYSHTLNILKQGLSISIIIYAIGKMVSSKKYLISLIIAPLIHWASFFFSILVFISKRIKNLNTLSMIIIYSFFSTLFLTNTSSYFSNIINFILPDNAYSYLALERLDYYGGAYKIQFWLFNTFNFILFLSPLIFKKLFVQDKLKNYRLFFQYFTINSSIFFVFGFIPFSDRIAAYSWMLIPILLTLFIDSIKIPNYFKFLILIIIIIMGYITTPLDGRFF